MSGTTPWERPNLSEALESLVLAAAANIPGAEFASISVRRSDGTLTTVASTDPLAVKVDELQYDLREGPCYAAVTSERFVLVNDIAASSPFPRYGPLAAGMGIGSQLAMQLSHNGERAGLNVYARYAGVFDRSTVAIADLFATQAATLLGYALQVDTLGEAVHTRQDIGTAVGIIMERYGIDTSRAFEFLTRISSHRNVKIRAIAQQIIDGSFDPGLDDG